MSNKRAVSSHNSRKWLGQHVSVKYTLNVYMQKSSVLLIQPNDLLSFLAAKIISKWNRPDIEIKN